MNFEPFGKSLIVKKVDLDEGVIKLPVEAGLIFGEVLAVGDDECVKVGDIVGYEKYAPTLFYDKTTPLFIMDTEDIKLVRRKE